MDFIANTLANVGFIMALVGSIILIIVGVVGVLGLALLIFSPIFAIGSFFYGIAMIILGILCAGASRFASSIWGALWLMILAIIASLLGAVFAAWLIILGAIIGVISRL